MTNEVIKVIRQASQKFAGIAAATQSPMLKDQADVLEELARTLVTPSDEVKRPQQEAMQVLVTHQRRDKPEQQLKQATTKRGKCEDLDLGSQRTEDISPSALFQHLVSPSHHWTHQTQPRSLRPRIFDFRASPILVNSYAAQPVSKL